MEKNKYVLKDYLKDAASDSLSVARLRDFVHFCFSLLLPFFHNHNEPIVHYLYHNGLTYKDLCSECLGSLLRLDENNQPLILKNFIKTLNREIEGIDDVEIIICFRRYMQKAARNYLIFLECTYDSAAFKIRRNIKYYCSHTPEALFYIQNEITGKILYPINSEYNLHLPFLSYEEFENMATGGRKYFDTTSRTLKFLYERITEEQNARRAIPLKYIIRILKYQQIGLDEEGDLPYETQKGNNISRFEVDQALQLIEIFLAKKIFDTYISKGISEKEAEAMIRCCYDIITDISFTGGNDNYFEYFNNQYKIQRQSFDDRFRNKIDYMIKLSKDLLYTLLF